MSAGRGATVHELQTPALIVERSSLEHNISTMAAALPGARLRPHVKAHKSTALAALQAAAGKMNVIETTWRTGSEDFSYYGEKAPSFFFYLGGMPKGNDPAKAPAHHTADFYIDESGFDVGVKAFCEIVFNYASLKNK